MSSAIKDELAGLAMLADSAPAVDRVALVHRRVRRRRRARLAVTAAALTVVTTGGLGVAASIDDRHAGTVAQPAAAHPKARSQVQVVSPPGARTVRLRIRITGEAYPLRWAKTGALLPGPQTGILSGQVVHFEGAPERRTFDRPPEKRFTCVYSDAPRPIDVTLEDSFTYPRAGTYTVSYSFGVCAEGPGYVLDERYHPAASFVGGDLTVVVR